MTTSPASTHLRREADGHLYWLDPIRAVATLIVVLLHYVDTFLVPYSALPDSQKNPFTLLFYILLDDSVGDSTRANVGYCCVLVFFTLSGYLVGGNVVNRIINRNFNATRFAVDRFVRLMLPYSGALLMSTLIDYLRHCPNIPELIGNIFFLQGVVCGPCINATWTLSYEAWFYILLFAAGIILLCKGSATARLWALATILLVGIFYLRLNPIYLFVLAMGAAARFIFRQRRRSLLWIGAIGMVVICVPLTMKHSMGGGYIDRINAMLNIDLLELVFSFFTAIFLGQVVMFPPKGRFWLAVNRIGTRMAAFSYSLYLFHTPFQRLVQNYGAPITDLSLRGTSLFILWTLLAIGFSYIMYLLLERHTKSLRNYLLSKIKGCTPTIKI